MGRTDTAGRLLPGFMLGIGAAIACTLAVAEGAGDLRARHEARAQALADSPFKRPLLLDARIAEARSNGEVDAVVDHGFAAVSRALRDAGHWCHVFLLQTNVKRCVADGGGEGLRVFIVRKAEEGVADAYEVAFGFRRIAATDGHLSVALSARAGPLGTSDYRLSLEAVPLDGRRTIVRMSYAYTTGMAARLATQAYLAGAGRDKVGFTIVGRDTAGTPSYIGGMQGVAERNTMRYFLAIESLLDTIALPPAQQVDTRLKQFHAALEKYPRQLHELSEPDYLAMKRRELQAP